MQVKLIKVLELKTLSERIKDLKLPLKLMYKLSKFFEAVEKESDFYSTQVRKILDEYAEKDEHGAFIHPKEDDPASIQIKPNCTAIVVKLLNELLAVEATLPDFNLTFEEAEQLNLSMNEFNALLPFIEEEKEDSK